MERHFTAELFELQQKLLTMASHAETAVNEAVRALATRDDKLAQTAQDRDVTIDQLEKEVDEKAINLLARAPLASDLRLVTVAMKISQNLERIGDEATKIAKRVRDLNGEPPLKSAVDIPGLTRSALAMLKDALDAFVNRDAAAARTLINRDKPVNDLNRENHQQLISAMLEDRENITRCLHLMVISKSLERIADHAVNIAEEVVYLREAQDIRHLKHAANPVT